MEENMTVDAWQDKYECRVALIEIGEALRELIVTLRSIGSEIESLKEATATARAVPFWLR